MSLHVPAAVAGRALIHVVLRRRGVTPHFVPPISARSARAAAHRAKVRPRGLLPLIERFETGERPRTR